MTMDFLRRYYKNFICLSYDARIMLMIYMFQCVSAGVAFFIAIYLKIHLNLNAETIGFIVSLFATGNLIGAIGAARVLDKVNPFFITIVSLLLQGGCFLSIAIIPSVYCIGLAMFFLGVSGYAYVVSSEFLIVASSGHEEQVKSSAISFINISSNMGVGLGGVFVTVFSELHSKQLLMGIGLSLLFLSAFYLRPKKAIDIGAKENSEEVNKAEEPSYRSNIYYLCLFFIFVLGLVFAQQRVSYSLFLESNFGSSAISSLLLLNSLLIIVFLPSVNDLSQKLNKVRFMGVGGLMLAGGMALYQFTHSYFIVFFLCVVTTFGEMIGTLLSQFLCFQSAKPESKGKAMGYYKFLYALGTILGTSLGGYVQQHYGMSFVWTFCGILAIVMLIATYASQNTVSVELRAATN